MTLVDAVAVMESRERLSVADVVGFGMLFFPSPSSIGAENPVQVQHRSHRLRTRVMFNQQRRHAYATTGQGPLFTAAASASNRLTTESPY